MKYLYSSEAARVSCDGVVELSGAVNKFDFDIVRDSLKRHVQTTGGISSLDTAAIIRIAREVINEIEIEAEQYPDFKTYWCDHEN